MVIDWRCASLSWPLNASDYYPLASPQIFGVNSGASFVIVLVTILIPSLGNYATYLAFLGAFIGGLTVYVLSDLRKNNTN